MMIGASLVSLFVNGVERPEAVVVMDFDNLEVIFGNTIFVFIMHHSMSGIIYPIRPQKKVYPMLAISFIGGGLVLMLEAVLASFAFGSVENTNCMEFPCKVSVSHPPSSPTNQKLYNQNFLAIPVVGAYCNFYPMLNVAAVPILTITLRNNIFEVFGVSSSNVSGFCARPLPRW